MSWQVFNDWKLSKRKQARILNWKAINGLIPLFRKVIETKYKTLNSLIKEWDSHLNFLGGDPTRFNWSNFRPLRLSREEDWSDWLAHLIATSTTGCFAHSFLHIPGFSVKDYSLPVNVEREISHQDYRADIIIEFQNNVYTHIEVKIGDEHLDKTYETGEMLRKKKNCSNRNWWNYILLLSEQVRSWEETQLRDERYSLITGINWDDVCVAIRKSLLQEESLPWKVWAYTFLGAIEQQLIRFPGHLIMLKPQEYIDEKITIMKKGLEYG